MRPTIFRFFFAVDGAWPLIFQREELVGDEQLSAAAAARQRPLLDDLVRFRRRPPRQSVVAAPVGAWNPR